MAIYAIGDIHGSLDQLERLLDRLEAQGPIDRLWFVGDLVNRGPDSAGVVRRVKALGERAITVLGNHDLALLGIAQRKRPKTHADESLHPLLDAADRDELLNWLRHRPLMHQDASLGWTLVHAGLPPSWTVEDGLARAKELENALRGPDHQEFLRHLFGNTPAHWQADRYGTARLRFIANALTRIRLTTADGGLDMKYKKTLAQAPPSLVPWFAHPDRRSSTHRLVFGHWSALETVAWPDHRVWGIDTGAAWGGPLTAMRLDATDPSIFIAAEPNI